MALETLEPGVWESRLLRLAHHALDHDTINEPIHDGREHLAQAYAHCTAITKQHSRTFYLASGLLPKEQRHAVRALYAFCRVSDDLVDKERQNQHQRILQWRQESLANHPPIYNLVALAWADTRANFNIPRRYAEQLLDGVTSDLIHNRYETFAELAQYCYGVASTVGLMAMHIVGYEGHKAIPYAIKLGVALQLTNILRDVQEDWANGRLYLPLEELRMFNLTEDDIAAGTIDHRWRAFMRFQIRRARQLYAEALPGVAMLGKNGRFAIAAAAELYRAILDDIEEHDYDVFGRRAHTTKQEKLNHLPGIWWRAKTNQYAQLVNQPVHTQPALVVCTPSPAIEPDNFYAVPQG
ncbi:MAG: squalene/phytoene synthase family protein [Anaerolineales bacterium]|nr:squalene/phytoene synthase family protein [Anaerolineales bacterium]MCB8936913.1 squalene/phytoene synthase family protein [Ardenticatenaceae bacterium]